MVTHKLILLSIGQKMRDLNRTARTRSTRVLGNLDATTAAQILRAAVKRAVGRGR
jgi:hypothetical protein